MTIPPRDVRTLLRIVGEVRELGHDTRAWRAHLLERLATHLGARIGMSLTMPLPHVQYFDAFHARANEAGGHHVVGHGCLATRETVLESIRDLKTSGDPTLPFQHEVAYGSFTITRPQILCDRDWYASEHVQERRRRADLDAFILSQYHVPGCGWHTFGIHRAWRDKPFREHERWFVELLHGELAELWTRHGVTGGPRIRAQLSPQLRRVFERLCQGLSEKEVAAAMSLSQHTVHDYVKELYRRLGVRGRGELLERLANQSRIQAAPVW
jgi:DNA-binding CsgD family transcriptional regulator